MSLSGGTSHHTSNNTNIGKYITNISKYHKHRQIYHKYEQIHEHRQIYHKYKQMNHKHRQLYYLHKQIYLSRKGVQTNYKHGKSLQMREGVLGVTSSSLRTMLGSQNFFSVLGLFAAFFIYDYQESRELVLERDGYPPVCGTALPQE